MRKEKSCVFQRRQTIEAAESVIAESHVFNMWKVYHSQPQDQGILLQLMSAKGISTIYPGEAGRAGRYQENLKLR